MSASEAARTGGWRGDIRGRALWVVFGCLICQLGLGFGYVLGPLAPDILSEFGWTRAMYSSARAPQLFLLALASPLVGTLAVRFGARSILVGSAILMSCVFLLFGQLQNLWQLYGVVMLMGLAVAGLGDITVGHMVSQWVNRGRGLALGIVYTGSNLGGFLLVPFAVSIAERHSWREAVSAMGVIALVVMLPAALWMVREPPPPSEQSDDVDEIAATVQGHQSDLDVRQAMRTRSFWVLAISLFTFFFYFLGMLEHLVLFLTDEGMSRSEAAWHFKNAIGIGMVSKIVLGAIADRIPHRTAILLDYAVLATSSVVLFVLPSPAFIWFFVLTYGFSVAARDVVYPLMIGDCFGLRSMASIYGMLTLALIPGGALGPLFAAAVHDQTGSYDIAFATFAVANWLTVGALFLLRDERPETRLPPGTGTT